MIRLYKLIPLLLFSVLLCNMGCGMYVKQKNQVIKEFNENRETFDAVATYMASFDWDENATGNYPLFFINNDKKIPTLWGGKENAMIPFFSEDVKLAMECLYALDYLEQEREIP